MGPRRENNLTGTDLPEAPSIGAVLGGQHEVLVIESECRRPRQDSNVWREAVGILRIRKGLLVHQDDAIARLRRRVCRASAGRAAADDQDLAMRVSLVEAVGSRLRRQAALAIQAGRLQSIDELDLGRTDHRFGPDVHQRVRFLAPGAEDTARTAVGHASGNHADVVCQQRGGKSIARITLIGMPVECEADWPRAVDSAALGQAAHRRSFAAGVGDISWVTVSRTTLNHRRQPAEWTQRSAIFPFGFGRKKT